MGFLARLGLFGLLAIGSDALRYDPEHVGWNLNENQEAIDPMDYSGEWKGHKYHPSPKNWRFPFYTLFMDKFVNGDPTNDNANGTQFEHDWMQTQLRHGGDIQGLIDSLDYIKGMGVKGLYVAGSPFINFPWTADQYSILDHTLLDRHFGDIAKYREMVEEIHKRGMYIIADTTLATMGDLLGAAGFLNASTPFKLSEYKVVLRDKQRQYHDFRPQLEEKRMDNCPYPQFWDETGAMISREDILKNDTSSLSGTCYDSEFNQVGDIEAFGVFPDWQRQLAKFASVQDRLREWIPSVREKLEHFACLSIAQLDIDGYRYDKATQMTVDALADFSQALRVCAKKYGKDNFFLPGEITGGNTFGSLFLGRGRTPTMKDKLTFDDAMRMDNNSKKDEFYIRPADRAGLDAGAFHYSVYRSLTRFLGMDGNLAAGYDVPVDWVDAWGQMILSNDFVNPNTNELDPRHMYGVANQDVFRWPAIKNGVERQLLGSFITTIHLPGIPLMLWGEEQGFYVLDSTASNYVFGRQAMSSATAWQSHGCYQLGAGQYYTFDDEKAKQGCHDDWNSLDHRDPSAPIRNIIKHMHQMRENFPVLNDGFFLQPLSKQTRMELLPGSNVTETEFGMWSVVRSRHIPTQDLSGAPGVGGNQSVWLVYQNEGLEKEYKFDCSHNDTDSAKRKALISPFSYKEPLRNLFYPYDELKMEKSNTKLGFDFDEDFNGCLTKLTLRPWEFRAYVPSKVWVRASPMLTKIEINQEAGAGHDARIASSVERGQTQKVPFKIQFSQEMNCKSVIAGIKIKSTTAGGKDATLDEKSVKCENIPREMHLETESGGNKIPMTGTIPSMWRMTGQLDGVHHGVHEITIDDVSAETGNQTTGSKDKFIFRLGSDDNPIVFPRIANYSSSLLVKDGKKLKINHKADGADQWRYTLDWTHWSDWQPYTGGESEVDMSLKKLWSGTKKQEWKGEHVIVQYFSRAGGSSDHVQHGDIDYPKKRRFPHLFAHGEFNAFGFEGGIINDFKLEDDSTWKYNVMTEWPTDLQINEWGMNPDGEPDATGVYGDVDMDGILDRMPPSSLSKTALNISSAPNLPHMGYQVQINDATLSFRLVPVGNMWLQIIIFIVMTVAPIMSGMVAVWVYQGAFYSIKFNKIGVTKGAAGLIPAWMKPKRGKKGMKPLLLGGGSTPPTGSRLNIPGETAGAVVGVPAADRRTVLIATMEYDIKDWDIKIKIGGLGVMAQLMGANLGHQDLIWVVPCVGGIDYPEAERAEPMTVTILGSTYEVEVQYHVLNNITYVLLDAPVFRKQTKSDPYPPRMDDLESAVYYSTWNQCIALAIARFPVDLYHINDYHGAAAPLYMLPDRTIPICLSLHNAEFQGLWPLRTPKEFEEVCSVFNLSAEIVEKYVQFGDVFNLLHAGASYLRLHQKGFGAVGVSAKYGARSHARYPIFWGLKKIGQLPNPDPTDLGAWTGKQDDAPVKINEEFEAARAGLKQQAQEWAGLHQDPEAELFVFVGRWSMQKGVDLIADVFPAVLEQNPHVQLLCVGPVIDLYGKFAALKLDVMMKKYPGRVFSKPEFTALPPFIFSGATFALIPSRDEPFGLVAVEFGRKGALGVGARVGGLGQMPGWWFTVESTTTAHMLHQFKQSIKEALKSDEETRRKMRARSAVQRFPVAAWVEQLENLQGTAIKLHVKEVEKVASRPSSMLGLSLPGKKTRGRSGSATYSRPVSGDYSRSRSGSGVVSGAVTPQPGNSPPQNPVYFNPVYSMSGAQDSQITLGPEDFSRTRNPFDDASTDADLGVIAGTPDYFNQSSDYDLTRPASTYSRPVSLLTPDDSPPDGQSQSHEQRSRFREGEASAGDSLLSSQARDASAIGSAYRAGRPRPISMVSLQDVVGDKKDFQLQKVDADFTDAKGEYYNAFAEKLATLDAGNSEDQLCIEEYLVKSEREWYSDYKNAKLGRQSRDRSRSRDASRDRSRSTGRLQKKGPDASVAPMPYDGEQEAYNMDPDNDDDEWLLGQDYKPPTGISYLMQRRVGDWPVYSFFLAFGQIMAANSYQVTLLSGTMTNTAIKTYITGAIYIVFSLVWWGVFRKMKAIYVLSVPFIFYGLAFLLLGLVPIASSSKTAQLWLQNVATGVYAAASPSGSIFFALNFGDEGGSPIKSWVFRACMIQGSQQIYIVGLWAWGNYQQQVINSGAVLSDSMITVDNKIFTAIMVPIAALIFGIGAICFWGLPKYYRQAPGHVPSFYKAVLRRKIVIWFLYVPTISHLFPPFLSHVAES